MESGDRSNLHQVNSVIIDIGSGLSIRHILSTSPALDLINNNATINDYSIRQAFISSLILLMI